MVKTRKPIWMKLKNAETEQIEQLLGPHFQRVDAYRVNSASIRVRVVDEKFDGLSERARDRSVEKYFKQLRKEISNDIMVLLTMTPAELDDTPVTMNGCLNYDFENPPTDL